MIVTDSRAIVFASAALEGHEFRPNAKAIGWERDGVILSAAVYEDYTGSSVTATIVNTPGCVLNRDFLHAIFHYPFHVLEVGLIIAFVAESNWKSRHLVESMGFVLEHQIAGAYPDGAACIYTMTLAQCRWLEKENGTQG